MASPELLNIYHEIILVLSGGTECSLQSHSRRTSVSKITAFRLRSSTPALACGASVGSLRSTRCYCLSSAIGLFIVGLISDGGFFIFQLNSQRFIMQEFSHRFNRLIIQSLHGLEAEFQ